MEDAATPEGGSPRYRAEALEHVANGPIACHVLDTLESVGADEVLVASSTELAGEVRASLANREGRAGARLTYLHRPGPMDLSAALSLAAPVVADEPCIVHLASGLLGEPLDPLVRSLRLDGPDATILVHQSRCPDRRLSAATQQMLHLAEFDPDRAALGMAGVSLYGAGALRLAATAEGHRSNELDLTLAASKITAAGGTMNVILAESWRRYAGDPLDLLELNRIALDRLESDHNRSHSNGNRIEGHVKIDERASVFASVIVGPAVIGPGAQIVDAYIGPYTSIGSDARIEGTEIERSIVSAGASIMHVGGRLAASVIGRNSRVFRDFSVPRALRLRIGDGTEVALC